MLSVLELPLSLAAARSGTEGAAGAVVSMVTLSAAEAAEMLPAASVAVAVMLCVPAARARAVVVSLALVAVRLLAWPPSLKILTLLPASAVPVKVGVVTLVMLSVLELQLSLPTRRSSDLGAAGAVVSMVTLSAAEAAEMLPAASVAVAVMLCVPAARARAVVVSLALVAVRLLAWPPSLKILTLLPASAVPVKVGVVTLVMLSVLELQLSLPTRRSSDLGAAGAVVSMVTLSAAEAAEMLPAASVAVAVMLCVPAARARAEERRVGKVGGPLRTWTPSLKILTLLPASAVPVKVGVVTLVMLSVLELPLSLAAARSGAEGAAGAVVSMVTLSAAEAAEMLPAASVAVAVMLCVPAARA